MMNAFTRDTHIDQSADCKEKGFRYGIATLSPHRRTCSWYESVERRWTKNQWEWKEKRKEKKKRRANQMDDTVI